MEGGGTGRGEGREEGKEGKGGREGEGMEVGERGGWDRFLISFFETDHHTVILHHFS